MNAKLESLVEESPLRFDSGDLVYTVDTDGFVDISGVELYTALRENIREIIDDSKQKGIWDEAQIQVTGAKKETYINSLNYMVNRNKPDYFFRGFIDNLSMAAGAVYGSLLLKDNPIAGAVFGIVAVRILAESCVWAIQGLEKLLKIQAPIDNIFSDSDIIEQAVFLDKIRNYEFTSQMAIES